MKYTITQGAIAAIQFIQRGDERPYSAVYMGPENLDPLDATVFPVEYDCKLPVEVKAAVNRNFGVMFSVPVHRREALIRTIQVQVVDVFEGETK